MFLRTVMVGSCIWTMGAVQAQAQSECKVTPYTPDAVSQRLVADFGDDGIAVLPGGIQSESLPAGRTTLVRGASIVGQLGVATNSTKGVTTLTVADASGATIMSVEQDLSKPCLKTDYPTSGTSCMQIGISTTLMPAGADGTAPMILQIPFGDDHISYFVQGAQVYPPVFHRAVAETMSWVRSTLRMTSVITTPVTATADALAFWSLAGEVAVAPYLGTLTISTEKDGTLLISGKVPSSATFDAIVQGLQAHGITNFDPELVIDTSMPSLPVIDGDVFACPIEE